MSGKRKRITTYARHYHVGIFRHWTGATVFWQIGTRGQVRTGKIMPYDSKTGKRIKKPFNHITWAYSLPIARTITYGNVFPASIYCRKRLKNQCLWSRVRKRLSLPRTTYPNIFGWLLEENMDVSKVAASCLCWVGMSFSSQILMQLHTGKKNIDDPIYGNRGSTLRLFGEACSFQRPAWRVGYSRLSPSNQNQRIGAEWVNPAQSSYQTFGRETWTLSGRRDQTNQVSSQKERTS